MSSVKLFTRTLGLAAMAAVVVGFAGAAHASTVPPTADSALLGTWINTDAASRSVKQVIVTPAESGNVTVDAFGACTPTLCEWGQVPAIVYGTNVSAPTGLNFQTNQRFLSGDREWSRTTLFGKAAKTRAGLRLTLRELTVFEDGSGRHNYAVTETFKRGEPQRPTRTGNPVSSYQRGYPPALVVAARGVWHAVSPSGGLVKIVINGSALHPVVQAFGACSPTACAWGRSQAITYGDSIGSTQGRTLLAPYTFGFKNAQLVITYSRDAERAGHLTVSVYSEFTDGSGRSNYVLTQDFVR